MQPVFFVGQIQQKSNSFQFFFGEIGAKRLTIRREARLKPILEGLGARVVEAEGQFRPLGSTEAAQVRHHGAHHHLAGEDGSGPGEEA